MLALIIRYFRAFTIHFCDYQTQSYQLKVTNKNLAVGGSLTCAQEGSIHYLHHTEAEVSCPPMFVGPCARSSCTHQWYLKHARDIADSCIFSMHTPLDTAQLKMYEENTVLVSPISY